VTDKILIFEELIKHHDALPEAQPVHDKLKITLVINGAPQAIKNQLSLDLDKHETFGSLRLVIFHYCRTQSTMDGGSTKPTKHDNDMHVSAMGKGKNGKGKKGDKGGGKGKGQQNQNDNWWQPSVKGKGKDGKGKPDGKGKG
jgi:hypothetical protein